MGSSKYGSYGRGGKAPDSGDKSIKLLGLTLRKSYLKWAVILILPVSAAIFGPMRLKKTAPRYSELERERQTDLLRKRQARLKAQQLKADKGSG